LTFLSLKNKQEESKALPSLPVPVLPSAKHSMGESAKL